MRLRQNLRNILLALAVLLVASLACNMPGVGQESPGAAPIPVTTEALESLEEELNSASEEAASGQRVTVTVTEEQLTSLVAFELQSQPEPVLTDPQILLRDGQIHVTGNFQQSGISAPLTAILNVTVDAQGQPRYEVVSANLGPLPLPQSVLEQLTAQLDEALGDQLNPETNNMIIEDIVIADGVMTITGRSR